MKINASLLFSFPIFSRLQLFKKLPIVTRFQVRNKERIENAMKNEKSDIGKNHGNL